MPWKKVAFYLVSREKEIMVLNKLSSKVILNLYNMLFGGNED